MDPGSELESIIGVRCSFRLSHQITLASRHLEHGADQQTQPERVSIKGPPKGPCKNRATL